MKALIFSSFLIFEILDFFISYLRAYECILGCVLLKCTNVLFEYTAEQWVNFAVSNVIGMLALSWVVGISYMLIVTLSVLQLREVLHPGVLAKYIRPQVSQSVGLKALFTRR